MKSLTGTFASARGWALLLTLFIGAGLMVTACGDEETPAPTTPTPAPTPPPAPPPEPEPPAVPTGLHVDEATASSITWHWTAVEGAVGYVVQASMDETWEATDTVSFDGAPFTTATEYTASGLDPETTVYVRVASAAGTVEAPVVSDFSTHVTGMTTAVPGPPAPTNLRLKNRGSDFIEWEWDAVEGADGYESEFSSNGTDFEAPQSHRGKSATTRKVSNLDAETGGYLRVRSYTGSGTGADTVRGDWSATDKQTTDEPPPAVPLSVPTDLEVTQRSDDSITLAWDDVDDAEKYEVEQRVAGGSWEAADCDGDGSEVADTQCVATGLDRGTEYNFRVAAIPDSDDETKMRSGWATLEDPVSTTGSAPTPIMGSGDLNVTWRSQGGVITWRWDQAGDVDYQIKVLPGALDSSKPCEGRSQDWEAAPQLGTSHRLDLTNPGSEARLLCVRTAQPDSSGKTQYGEPSWAWAAVEPTAPVRPNDASVARELKDGITESLTWTVTLAANGELDYDFRYLVDGQDDTKTLDLTTDARNQRMCEAAPNAETLTPGGATFTTFTTSGELTDYSAYSLCYRARNDSGRSDWAVGSGSEIYTAPSRPSAGSPTRKDNADNVGSQYDFSWVVTRPSGGPSVPSSSIGNYYDVYYVVTNTDQDSNGTDEAADRDEVIKACDGSGGDGVGARASISNLERTSESSNTRFTAKVEGYARPAESEPNRIIYFCARAKYDSTGDGKDPGPWVISQSTLTNQESAQ